LYLEKILKESVSNAWVMADFAENEQQGILADGGTSFKVTLEKQEERALEPMVPRPFGKRI
jgi:predicted HicB family RNase H-like nuclease